MCSVVDNGVLNTSLWLAAYPGVEGLGWENIGWKDCTSRFLFSPSNSFPKQPQVRPTAIRVNVDTRTPLYLLFYDSIELWDIITVIKAGKCLTMATIPSFASVLTLIVIGGDTWAVLLNVWVSRHYPWQHEGEGVQRRSNLLTWYGLIRASWPTCFLPLSRSLSLVHLTMPSLTLLVVLHHKSLTLVLPLVLVTWSIVVPTSIMLISLPRLVMLKLAITRLHLL